ncbi:MAG: FG-GAP-like repeat-containing protein [Prolixibacteraceae bacterium]|nr:FG-GAP-like repeat-containing protein [Prolixibacteraceae bacterium]
MKKIIYTFLMGLICAFTAIGHPFDLTMKTVDSDTQLHQTSNSITLSPGYSYESNSGTMLAEAVSPYVTDIISYNSPPVDPVSRPLNTSSYLVGTTKGTFNVNALGGAVYTIPLQVPDGVGGMTPSISLTYSSNGGNGIAGYGWNIGGLSAITRSPQTYYHDGTSVGVNLTSTDRFSLDGQRLICVSGSYGDNNSEYRTEIDNFSKITFFTGGTSTPKWFLVKTKGGETIEYGYEGDSDQTIDGLTEELSWYADKRIDLYGDTISYKYLKQFGHNYIEEIKYGPNTVTFYYKDRIDTETSFFMGATLQQNLILEKVEMKYNSTLVKKYELIYNYSNSVYGGASVLNEVVEYGISGSRYNSTAFSYEYPTGDCNNYPSTEYNNYISTNYTQYTGDFNGDGRDDIFTVRKSNQKEWRLFLGTEYGGFTYKTSGINTYDISSAVWVDLNGDNCDDLILKRHVGVSIDIHGNLSDTYAYYYALNIGTAFSTPTFFINAHYDLFNVTGATVRDPNMADGMNDMDGDGLADILVVSQSGWRIFGFTYSSGTLSQWGLKNSGSSLNVGDKYQLGDFNGDGKSEVWAIDSNGIKVYSLDGASFQMIYSGSYPDKDHLFKLGDFNGDGKTDIFIYGYKTYEWSEWQFRLSTGTGFVANYFPKKKSDLKSDVVHTGDFNGDGRTDILALSKNTSNNPRQYYFVTKPNATDVNSEYYERSEYNKDYQFTLGDYDGNGKTDIIVASATNGYRRGKITGTTSILLSRFADGLNNNGAFSYRKLSGEYSNYEKGTATVNFPVYTYMGSLNVVSEYWTNDGYSLNQDYSYKGLKIHRQGKGVLGYEQIVVEDSQSGNKTETNSGYNTTYFYPTVLSVENYVDGEKASETKNTWNEQETVSVTGLDPIFPYADYHLNKNVFRGQQDSTTFTYDPTIKGSLKEAKQRFDNGITKTTTNAYYSNDESNWYIGRIQESTVKFEKSGETTQSNKTTFTYSTDGILKPDFITYNVGTNWEYSVNHDYYSDGNLKQTYQQAVGLEDRDTDYEYETNGIRLKKVTDPLRFETNYIYDTYGRLQKETDHRGNETTFTYDSMSRLAKRTQPDGLEITTTYGWGLTGGLTLPAYSILTSVNDGSQSKVWYDREGMELRSDVKTFGGSWVYNITEYDNKRRLSKKYEPSFSTISSRYTLYEYDTKNRLNKITTAGGKVTNIDYAGNRVTEISEGMTSWKETNSQGMVSTASDFGGDMTYSYYPNGQVKNINHPGGVTKMKYDAAGNQTELDDPSAGITRYYQNAYGRMTAQVNNLGDSTIYRYSSDGLLDYHTTGNETTDYTYDGYKQLTTVTSPGPVTRTHSYATTGVKGRITGILENIAGQNFSTTFEYDGVGRLWKRNHPSGVVEENVYDPNSGLLEKVKDGTTVVWDIDATNEYGQITSAKYGTNLTATMTYDQGLPLTASIDSLYQYSYGFDQKFGWPNSRTNNKHTLTENFGYENLRLDSIWGSTSNGFAYANTGNITRKGDLGQMEYDGYQITDLYTKNVSLIPVDTQKVNYTWFQQIKDITEGNYSAAFTYNSDQQRSKMVVSQNGTMIYTRWYPGSSYMKELNGSTETQYTWLGGNAYSAPAVSVKVGTGTPVIYYVLRDYLGSITHAVKSTDLTYREYSFDAWGRRRSADDWNYTLDASDQTLFAGRGFTGHEHLPEFGLINMNGRLYDPLLGRLLSPDNYVQLPDFSQNFNRYSYALNNPLLYTDPDGDIAFLVIAAYFAANAAIDYGIQVAMNYAVAKKMGYSTKDIWLNKIDFFDVGISGTIGAITGGASTALKAGEKVGKVGMFVLKHPELVKLGEIAVTSGIDITGEGWQPVEFDDFSKRMIVGAGTYYGTKALGEAFSKKNPSPSYNNASDDLPLQQHHFATNKNKTYTPQMMGIARSYGLDLDGDWNKDIMNHLGRHPNEYHEFVLAGMKKAAFEAGGDQARFIQLFDQYIKQTIISNPLLLRKSGW